MMPISGKDCAAAAKTGGRKPNAAAVPRLGAAGMEVLVLLDSFEGDGPDVISAYPP